MARQDRVVRLANQNEVLALLLNDHCAGLTRSDPWHLFFWAKDPGLDGDTPSLLLLSDNTIMPPGPQRIHTYPETIRAHAVYRFPFFRLQRSRHAKSRWNATAATARIEPPCGSGGTGRRARLRNKSSRIANKRLARKQRQLAHRTSPNLT